MCSIGLFRAFYNAKVFLLRAFCLALFISGICTTTLFADIMTDDIKPRAINSKTGYGVYISDYADYLSDDEEKKLVEDMKPVTSYGNVLFLSFTEENGYSYIGSTTEKFYLKHIGAYKSGVVFSVNPTDIYIYSEGDMYDVVDKKYAYTITDNIYKEAKDDNMYNCSVHCYQMIMDVIEGRRIAQPMKYICNTLLGLMMAILICFLYIHRRATINGTSENELLLNSKRRFYKGDSSIKYVNQTKIYSPRSSGSGGGFHGGHGGGGHHGGGGGHHR